MRLLVAAGLALALLAGGTAAGVTLAHTRNAASAAHLTAAAASPDALRASSAAALPCCTQLGPNMQLRWADLAAAPSDHLEFELAGALAEHAWMGWGPADPRASNRLMGSGDVVAAGISDVNGQPWATDMFLSGYGPCDTSAPPAVGVCPDATLNFNPTTGVRLASPGDATKLNSVTLVGGYRRDGVTHIRMRRKLAAADVLDHAIDPAKEQNFIWAWGQLSPADGAAGTAGAHPSLRLRQHPSNKAGYGALTGFKLASCPKACGKLEGTVAPAKPLAAAAGKTLLSLAGGGGSVAWAPAAGPSGAAGVAVHFAAARKSQWASLGVGTGMRGARAYVAWVGQDGALKTAAYNMTSYSSAGLKALPRPPSKSTPGPLGGITSASVSPQGTISFDAWIPTHKEGRLPLIWALGNGFADPPTESAQHFDQSSVPTYLDLHKGAPAAAHAHTPALAAPKAPAAAAPAPAAAPPPRPKVAVAAACMLKQPFELARLGDGWCDAGAPYNTADCAWDGGDCCNTQLAIHDCRDPASPNFGKSSRKGLVLPAPRNPRYSEGLGRVLSTRELVTTYNNFYEFSTDKDVAAYVTPEARAAMEVANPGFKGWEITIDGLVAKPMKIDVRDLMNMVHIEERVYRHRCVEAWAIVVPWLGFPIRKLLSIVQPLPGARYIRFETDSGSYMPNSAAPVLGEGGPTWPYVEAIALFEAWNDLAFMSIGQFNGTLTAQSGAPIRMTLPWKYGFKSIKSLRKISFTSDRPTNWWNKAAPSEYGFWANINPQVPHPRWSQAQEQILVDSPTAKEVKRTILFNNYTSEVAWMYPAADRQYYF